MERRGKVMGRWGDGKSYGDTETNLSSGLPGVAIYF